MMTKIGGEIEVFQALCKAHGKWGLFLDSPVEGDTWEIAKAVPWLADDQNALSALLSDSQTFLFDSEEELNRHYYDVVGEDGSTPTNPYEGPAAVYALTCDPTGQPPQREHLMDPVVGQTVEIKPGWNWVDAE